MKIFKENGVNLLHIVLLVVYLICGYLIGYNQGYSSGQWDYILFLEQSLNPIETPELK